MDKNQQLLEQIRKELAEGGTSPTLEALWRVDYERRPVDPLTFITDEQYLGKTCKNLYSVWKQVASEVFAPGSAIQELILTGAIGIGKCIPETATVYDAVTGRPYTVGEVYRSGISIQHQTFDKGLHSSVSRPVKCFSSGTKPLCKVTLRSGKEFCVSVDHPVRIGSGWKEAALLEIGELVATPRFIPEPVDTLNISDAELTFISYMIAEGCVCSGNCNFSNSNPRIHKELDRVSRALQRDIGSEVCGVTKVGSERSATGVVCEDVYLKGLRSVLRRWGLFDQKSADKCIPKQFFSLSNKQLSLFLNRLFAGDGHIKTGKCSTVVDYDSASETLIRQLQTLLLRFGIHSRIKSKYISGSEYWNLQIANATGILRFLDTTGPVFGKEKDCAAVREVCERREVNPNHDLVPFTWPQMRQVIKGRLSPYRERVKELRLKRMESSRYGFDSFQRIVSDLSLGGELGHLIGDVYWDEVVSVEELDPAPVYDFTVPDTHNFVVDNVIVHNSTFAVVASLYRIYRLCCLRDPQGFYRKLPGSEIVWGIYNIKLDKADVVYRRMKSMMDVSPFFAEVCPRLQRPDDPIRIPSKGIKVEIGSLAEHALSEDLFGIVIDEANFYRKTSNRVSATRIEEEVSRAHDLYKTARRRMVSRFMERGEIQGLIIMMSSQKYQSAFLNQRVEEIEEDEEQQRIARVYSFSHWEAVDSQELSDETFDVVIPDETSLPYIREPDEIVSGSVRVIENIPVDYEEEFKRDIIEAIRDIAGEPHTGPGVFFRNPAMLEKCVDPSLEHPFKRPVIADFGLNTNRRLEDYFDEEGFFYTRKGRSAPRLHPGAPRFIHVDIGLTEDRLGIGCSHPWESEIWFDFLIRISAGTNDEVYLEGVMNFLVWLNKMGLNLNGVTYDRFQSRQSVQTLVKKEIDAGYLSIQQDHYNVIKSALPLIHVYHYDPLFEELHNLRDGKKRPQHPPGGHDDVADGFTGSGFHSAEKLGLVRKKKGKKVGRVVDPSLFSSG